VNIRLTIEVDGVVEALEVNEGHVALVQLVQRGAAEALTPAMVVWGCLSVGLTVVAERLVKRLGKDYIETFLRRDGANGL